MSAQAEGRRKNFERFSFEDLRRECEGQWATIISALSAVDISQALATRKHVVCHKGHSKKKHFRLFKDFDQSGGAICTCGAFGDGFKLLDHLNGWDRKTAVKEVSKYLRDRGYKPRKYTKPPEPAKPAPLVVDEDNVAALRKIWSEAVPLKGTPGERYLRARGIDGQLPNTGDVGFHPRLRYWDSESNSSLGFFPGIVSVLRSSKSGHPLSIHRIYLDPRRGKANVPDAKKLMPVSVPGAITEAGGAIRLYELNGPVMAVAEGLETAAAVHCAHPDLPIWATYCATVLTNFVPPASVKHVYIFGDVDTSGTGQVASTRLALRLEAKGIKASICLPAKKVSVPSKESSWYTKDEPKERIVERLCKEGYFPATQSPNVDWLDVWCNSRQQVIDALKGPRSTK